MRPPRASSVAAGAYKIVAVALTLLTLSDPYQWYYVRGLVLFPLSIPLLFADYIGGVLLFGPDPAGLLAAAYFILVGLAATAGQPALASLVLRLCCARTPATSE